MNESLRRTAVLTKRNVKEILRDPLSLIFSLGLPLAMEILFYLIFHKLTDQFSMMYLAPGIVVFSQAFLTLFTGMLIATDRDTSFLTRLFVSRLRAHEFILAYAVSILPMVATQSVLFFVIGGIFDPSIINLRVIPAILLSLVTSLMYISLGILFGCISNSKSIGGISSIVVTGQSVLSGMWFPMDQLGGFMVSLMNALPFRNTTLLIQNTLNGGEITRPLIIVLIYTAVSMIAAVLVFKKKMRARGR